MIIKFKVDGMSCNHCSNNVISSLEKFDSVNSVDVDLNSKEVTLDGSLEQTKIKEVIEDLGFDYLG